MKPTVYGDVTITLGTQPRQNMTTMVMDMYLRDPSEEVRGNLAILLISYLCAKGDEIMDKEQQVPCSKNISMVWNLMTPFGV